MYQKKDFYTVLPYISPTANKDIKKSLSKLIGDYFPQLNFKLIFKNDYCVESFFRFKDRVPTPMLSNVVYKYSCGQCTATYYGETTRHLKTRIAEHRGLSARTGQPLSRPPYSSIRDHSVTTGHELKTDSFTVAFTTNSINLRVSESILIHANRPSLNNTEASVPLNVLR